MQSAVNIIRGEHDSLAAVLHSLRRYVRPLRDHKAKPDCDVFATILSYIETFADRFHHPKEDEYLFRALRERTGAADATLLDLQHEHAAGPAELNNLKRALVRTRGGTAEVEEFAFLLERYAMGQEEHIRKEDEIVLPIAQRVLTAADWEPIDKAFRANRDPFFGIGATGPIGSLVTKAVALASA